ncbi:Nucleotidyltransferase [Marasmius fiardii PR-910]|nr:Nucleotidyltransferase [Marasmius fiardii PR-910]
MPKHSRAPSSSSSSSSVRVEGQRKKTRQRSPSSSTGHVDLPINVFIVDAKLEPNSIAELNSLVEDNDFAELQICSNVQDSDIIITAVRMRKRLERHLDWELAKQKLIVTPDWLRHSVEQGKLLPCADYAALNELVETTASHCPENICLTHEECTHNPPDVVEADSKEHHPGLFQRYACIRHSLLVCVNQKLVDQLSVLRRQRELEGWQIRALSYERTIAALKAYPHVITEDRLAEVAQIPFLGEKSMTKIKEFLRKGKISEYTTILVNERYLTLSAFTSIYGIGPSTARNLYSMNFRTLNDLDRYYGVNPDPEASTEEKLATVPHPHDRKLNLPQVTILVSLALRHDLAETIPRHEVEEMRDVVMAELDQIKPGCVSTITGGYRRGKPESNDVDIVISHRDLKTGRGHVIGLCAELVQVLYSKGVVTHVMHLSSFHKHNALRTTHWDSLEKALTIFILPDDGKCTRRIHRRLDLIFAVPEVYWSAVTGWTGSKMFERDLRLWAKEEKGMKFDSSGITRRHDSKPYFPKSEREVFKILGLDWVDPIMRNADA